MRFPIMLPLWTERTGVSGKRTYGIIVLFKKGVQPIMGKVKEFLKRRTDWVLMLIGSFLTAYGVFDFRVLGGRPYVFSRSENIVHAFGYSYASGTTFIIALGITLVVLGILIHKEKNR